MQSSTCKTVKISVMNLEVRDGRIENQRREKKVTHGLCESKFRFAQK